ncbi:autotransporter-associated beta strand repeat-containing protein [Prosthecobacter sp.]|uniref:autotransporter-associated beta strand repeat-containing protein n=1 Tax=Prosthecobacter sp. TaxID=1965333 RepID=UPI0037839DBA
MKCPLFGKFALFFGCFTAMTSMPLQVLGVPLVVNYTDGQNSTVGLDTVGGMATLTVDAGTATQSGVISGTGGINKTGAGTLIISGLNTYESDTLVKAGVLEISSTGGIGNGAANLQLGFVAGDAGTVRISGGLVQMNETQMGFYASTTGTLTMTAGSMIQKTLVFGNAGTGVLNLSGGSVITDYFDAAGAMFSSATLNVSGGSLTVNRNVFLVGDSGTAVMNLTNGAVVNAGSAGTNTLYLGANYGSAGTLNIGTGGMSGTLNAAYVEAANGTGVVNFNHTDDIVFNPQFAGDIIVNQIGSGTTTLTQGGQGAFNVLGGKLELAFGGVTSNMLAWGGVLTLGSATLELSGTGTQFLQGLNVVARTGGNIVLGANETLQFVEVTLGAHSALHFDTSAGGADGQTAGSGNVVASLVSSPSMTLTDSTGFGLAVTDFNTGNVVRDTTTALLPASGADEFTDYLIDNNNGGSAAAGGATLLITSDESTQSITVDTTAREGVLTIGSGVRLSTDVLNFGGVGTHGYTIAGADGGASISATTGGGTLQINNWNQAPVTLGVAIRDTDFSSLQVNGTGTLILTGDSNYRGKTYLTHGTVVIDGGGYIHNNSSAYVGYQAGDHAVLNVKNGSFWAGADGAIGTEAGSTGTVMVGPNGYMSQSHDLMVGLRGTGVVDVNGGSLVSDGGVLGSEAGSSGTVNIRNGAHWNMSTHLAVGVAGTGVLNVTEGSGVLIGEGLGTISVGAGSTINMGLGGAGGFLGAYSVTGDGGSTLNFDSNTDSMPQFVFSKVQGDISVNKMGSGQVVFLAQNTYTGATTVNGGVLELQIDSHPAISSSSPVVLGGGTLLLSGGNGSQSIGSLTTTASTGSAIVVESDESIFVDVLKVGAQSALNFNTAAGGADGADAGTSSIFIDGLTTGQPISNGYTVTDSTGFGLATVDSDGQVIRLTGTSLLPVTGALPGVDYLVNDANGTYTSPGSLNMIISANESARSITVDTTAATGALTLDGANLGADVWNFGSSAPTGNNYQITSFAQTNGLTTTTAGGVMMLNNYLGNGTVFVFAPILDNGGSGLLATGTGLTYIGGRNTYTGATTVNSGVLYINGNESAATGTTTVQTGGILGGTGTLGGGLVLQQGGTLTPGSYLMTGYEGGTLNGTTATFESGSVFSLHGSGEALPTLHLTGAVSIAEGAYLNLMLDNDLTESSYTLITAASGLDGTSTFTLMYPDIIPSNYSLVYTGTSLQLNLTAVPVAYWTGAVSNKWSDISNGSSNWATTVDGTTDTHALPTAPTDVYFAATNASTTDTILDTDFTIKSLTINSDTTISRSDDPHTLTVNNATTVNALLAVNFGVTLSGGADLTVNNTGTLAGDGTVQLAEDKSMYIYGTIAPGRMNSPNESGPLTLTTSGTGSIVMGAGSVIVFDINYGAGDGDNTGAGQALSSTHLSLHGKLDVTAGGTLVIHNPNNLTAFAGGDQWQLVNLNAGNNDGSIVGTLAVDDSALGLAAGMAGTFDQSTGIYSIADFRGQLSAVNSGLPMAGAEILGIIAAAQTATTDVNNHLFNLRSGGGDEDEGDGSISASLDYGVVEGQGDGPESPMVRRLKADERWEIFSTVAYGNVRLNPINSQAGVQIDSWASSVGVERRVCRGLTLGFAATFLQSHQTYTSGLGSLDLEGPTLSAYLAYARKGVWASLMYSFGDYNLGSERNPGFGLPMASGSSTAYVNSLQYNTGYNFYFQDRTLVTGPFIGIDYLHGSLDAYSETGGGVGALAYARQTFESLVARAGWSVSKKLHTDWADITPQLRVSYERQNIHNNGSSVQVLNAPFTAVGGTQMPGRDYMVIGGGVNFQITPALSLLLNYQTQIFREGMTSHFGSIRLGYKF